MGIDGIKSYVNGQPYKADRWYTEANIPISSWENNVPKYESIIKFTVPSYSDTLVRIKINLKINQDIHKVACVVNNIPDYQPSPTGFNLETQVTSSYPSIGYDGTLIMQFIGAKMLRPGQSYYVHISPNLDIPYSYNQIITGNTFGTDSTIEIETSNKIIRSTYYSNDGSDILNVTENVPGDPVIFPEYVPIHESDFVKDPFRLTGISSVEGVNNIQVTANKVKEKKYIFEGWAEVPRSYTAKYQPGEDMSRRYSVNDYDTIRYYAVWGNIYEEYYENNSISDLPIPFWPVETNEEDFIIKGYSQSSVEDSEITAAKVTTVTPTLVGWITSDGTILDPHDSITFEQDTEFTAKWNVETKIEYFNNILNMLPIPKRDPDVNSRYFSITGNANGGDANTQLEAVYKDITNYQFIGWANEGSNTPLDMNTEYKSEADVYAIWSSYNEQGYENNTLNLLPIPNRSDDYVSNITVTLLLNGGTLVDSADKLNSGKMASYQFKSWNTSYTGKGENLPLSYQFLQATEVYATWTSSIYTKKVILPVPIKEDSVFRGWKSENELLSPGEYNPLRSITLTAIWQEPGSSYVDGQLYTACYDTGSGWIVLTPCYDTGSEWVT